jgi:hypothetical protein
MVLEELLEIGAFLTWVIENSLSLLAVRLLKNLTLIVVPQGSVLGPYCSCCILMTLVCVLKCLIFICSLMIRISFVLIRAYKQFVYPINLFINSKRIKQENTIKLATSKLRRRLVPSVASWGCFGGRIFKMASVDSLLGCIIL